MSWTGDLRAAVTQRIGELRDMSVIYSYAAKGAVVHWEAHGATISAVSPGTAADAITDGYLHRELTEGQVEGYRTRWARHRILDESTANSSWLAAAGVIGLPNAGQDHTAEPALLVDASLSDTDVARIAVEVASRIPAPPPIDTSLSDDDLQRIAQAVIDEIAS